MVDQSLLTMVHRAVYGEAARSGATTEQTGQGTASMGQQRSEMMRASDDYALNLIANAGTSKAEADELWRARWQASSALQLEFAAMADYVAYMNAALATTKQRAKSQPVERSLSSSGLDKDEALAIEAARTQGLSAEEMTPQWHARYAASPALRAEFRSRESYAVFMNAAAAGLLKIHRGRVV